MPQVRLGCPFLDLLDRRAVVSWASYRGHRLINAGPVRQSHWCRAHVLGAPLRK